MQNNDNVMTEISNYVQGLEVKKQKEDFFFYVYMQTKENKSLAIFILRERNAKAILNNSILFRR